MVVRIGGADPHNTDAKQGDYYAGPMRPPFTRACLDARHSFRVNVHKTGGHSIAPKPQAPMPQAPVRNRKTRKVANAKVRIG